MICLGSAGGGPIRFRAIVTSLQFQFDLVFPKIRVFAEIHHNSRNDVYVGLVNFSTLALSKIRFEIRTMLLTVHMWDLICSFATICSNLITSVLLNFYPTTSKKSHSNCNAHYLLTQLLGNLNPFGNSGPGT